MTHINEPGAWQHSTTGYAYEEIAQLPEIKLMTQEAFSATKEGEWEGFWIDPETGYHWGTREGIGAKLGKRDLIFSISAALRSEGIGKLIRDPNGQVRDALPYEVVELKMQEYLAIPQVALDGEWKGFYTDDSGRHWGHKLTLEHHLGTQRSMLRKKIKKHNLTALNIRNLNNGLYPAYCLEEVKSIIENEASRSDKSRK